MKYVWWSPAEWQYAPRLKDIGKSFAEIGVILNRKEKSVRQRFTYKGYFIEETKARADRNRIKKIRSTQDGAFILAMLGAIKSGAEKAVIGVVRDRRPMPMSRFHAEPSFSGCTSPALACAEYGPTF